MKRKYYINTRVAGVQYNEAIFCVEELKNGKKLKLVREEDNKFDPNAIAIYCDECKIGYIPSDENEELAIFLDQGWGNIFEVYICQYNPEQHPEKQSAINIYVRKNEK